MMASVEVSDYVLWTKHVHGDDHLRQKLELLEPGQVIALRVDGVTGKWRKMRPNQAGGYNVPGLTPLGQAKAAWGELYRRFKPEGGAVVELALADSPDAANGDRSPRTGFFWATDSLAEREAAWELVKASWTAGWSSDGTPYPSRDELHDRTKR
jgi:hypothetical protein